MMSSLRFSLSFCFVWSCIVTSRCFPAFFESNPYGDGTEIGDFLFASSGGGQILLVRMVAQMWSSQVQRFEKGLLERGESIQE